MVRLRFCKIGPVVLFALLLSILNTLIILVYLGPLNFRNDSNSGPSPFVSSSFKQVQNVKINSRVSRNREPEIQQISVVNQNDNHKPDFPTVIEKTGNTSKQDKVVSSWSEKFQWVPQQPDENLDHAYSKLKFNHDVMSMVGRSPVRPVDIVIGIPTVKRDTTDYLSSTLRNLVKFLNVNETKQCHVVVFCANFEQEANAKTADFIKKEFSFEVAAGLIEVIKPDISFYPKLTDLPALWKDKPDRVKWRSKQCVDYALLFAYCRKLGHYYLQLEDDVSVSQTYFREMKNFIQARGRSKWSNLQFGTGGFIGMLFKASDLGRLALFVKMYYWVFPVDILFRHYNDIHLYGNSPRDIYRPPLFQHLGRESSLKGQTRRIVGAALKNFRPQPNKRHYTDAKNPNAFISTNIQVFESNTIDGPYRTSNLGYFWGKDIKLNNFVVLEFMKEITLLRVVVESGSDFAQKDTLGDGKLETTDVSKAGNCNEQGYKLLSGTASNGKIDSGTVSIANVKCVKLTITKLNLDEKGNSRWLLIREIAVWSN